MAKELVVGQIVGIHPANDWFMKGVKYARVTKVFEDQTSELVRRRGRLVQVVADEFAARFLIRACDLLDEAGEPMFSETVAVG